MPVPPKDPGPTVFCDRGERPPLLHRWGYLSATDTRLTQNVWQNGKIGRWRPPEALLAARTAKAAGRWVPGGPGTLLTAGRDEAYPSRPVVLEVILATAVAATTPSSSGPGRLAAGGDNRSDSASSQVSGTARAARTVRRAPSGSRPVSVLPSAGSPAGSLSYLIAQWGRAETRVVHQTDRSCVDRLAFIFKAS